MFVSVCVAAISAKVPSLNAVLNSERVPDKELSVKSIVLFVSVSVPVLVATVLSIAIVISLSVTEVSIPVPPLNVKVSPVLKVSLDPLSAASVKEVVTLPTSVSTYDLIAFAEARVSSFDEAVLKSVSRTPDANIVVSMLETVLLAASIVLFVNVCVPDKVATVLSIAKVISLSATVEERPVPPVNVNVCPVVNVSLEPESAARSKDPDGTVAQDNCPAPSVFKYWLALPSACGQFCPSRTRSPVPFGVNIKSPLVSVEEIVLPLI